MRIHYQTWVPDTCRCKVEEKHDLDIKDSPMELSRVIRKCPAHVSVADNELYGVLYSNPDGENKRKNQILRVLLEHEDVKGIGLATLRAASDGKIVPQLREGVEYAWSFTGEGKDRVLHVEIKGQEVQKAKKQEIKDYCDQKYGVGKVEMV
jgi:hypothetical protein